MQEMSSSSLRLSFVHYARQRSSDSIKGIGALFRSMESVEVETFTSAGMLVKNCYGAQDSNIAIDFPENCQECGVQKSCFNKTWENIKKSMIEAGVLEE
jgi:hypothetical protein